jgi:hypothetical protein
MISLLGPPQELLNRADGAVYSGLYTTRGMHDSAGVCGILIPLLIIGPLLRRIQISTTYPFPGFYLFESHTLPPRRGQTNFHRIRMQDASMASGATIDSKRII